MSDPGGASSGEEPLVASGGNLKWKSKLIEEGTTIRQESEKAKVNVILHGETDVNGKGEPEYAKQIPEVSKGNIKPLAITHCCARLVPPELQFDAGSGTLENEKGQKGKFEGSLKVIGYGSEEVINAKQG